MRVNRCGEAYTALAVEPAWQDAALAEYEKLWAEAHRPREPKILDISEYGSAEHQTQLSMYGEVFFRIEGGGLIKEIGGEQ